MLFRILDAYDQLEEPLRFLLFFSTLLLVGILPIAFHLGPLALPSMLLALLALRLSHLHSRKDKR